MTTAIQFKHRLPPDDWKSSNSSIMSYVLPHVASSAILAQELFDAIGGLSTRDPTAVETIDEFIYKSKLIRDNLLDAAELLNDLDKDGGASCAFRTKMRAF